MKRVWACWVLQSGAIFDELRPAEPQMEAADLPTRVMAQKLIMEHEMGELFKVIGFYKGEPWDAMGFEHGDRTQSPAMKPVGRPALAPTMIRWLIVVFLALILINGLTPWLQKLGFGRLPGDIRFKIVRARIFYCR
jgi:hypothetical protein